MVERNIGLVKLRAKKPMVSRFPISSRTAYGMTTPAMARIYPFDGHRLAVNGSTWLLWVLAAG
jgi:hypothetical protein